MNTKSDDIMSHDIRNNVADKFTTPLIYLY